MRPQLNMPEFDNFYTPKNTFPIMAQLGVLLVIMLFLFGSHLFKESQSSPTTALKVDNKEYHLNDARSIAPIEEISASLSIRAEAAYVYDVRADRVLFSKNAEEQLPLASITKLMTTLVAYELVADDETYRVPREAILQEGSSGLSIGEIFDSRSLRELALVSSSNDAAFALAKNVGELLGEKDPVAQFVTGMNIRAEELGLDSLHFSNTTGLDINVNKPGAVGSARDISHLLVYLVDEYPEMIASTQDLSSRVYNESGNYHDINNTNQVARKIPNLIASKTGYTDLAGGNLTIAFDAGRDRPIIVTVLGSTYSERFSDVLKLVDEAQKVLSQPEK